MGPFGVVCSGRGVFVLDVIASIAGTRAKIEKDLEDMSQSSESLVESIESNQSNRINRINPRPFDLPAGHSAEILFRPQRHKLQVRTTLQ